MNENALAQILSSILGRPVNAAPSVANGGVQYRPTMQSSAPNNFMSMLLGALIGGGGNMGGGGTMFSGGSPSTPVGMNPSRPQGLPAWNPQGLSMQEYAAQNPEWRGGFIPSPGGVEPSNWLTPIRQAPTQRIPSFEEWMFQRTGGVVPTEPAIAQAETQTRPTVPQTGPTVNGKTYYPSPIPGSQNPQTPGSATPMMPIVQPYKQGTWQMPQLPQMWNPYGLRGGFGGFDGFGGGWGAYPSTGDPSKGIFGRSSSGGPIEYGGVHTASGYQQPQVSGLSLFGGFKQPSMNSMSYFGGGR